MHIAHPESLIWILLSVPMLLIYLGYWSWKRKVTERIGDQELLAKMMDGISKRRQIARNLLVVGAVMLLGLAAAQPQWGETNRPIKRTGVDIVFALDLSKSMLARDASPNRLEAAKNEIRTTMQILGGDRVGLVVFTAVSFQQSPLTTDYGAIQFYLKKLQPDQMPMGGTSIGVAIGDAAELLLGKSTTETSEGPEMKRAKNQVIVLITDGEDHESEPLSAAEKAYQDNIRIVTVGMGSTNGERIPIYKPDGSLAGFQRSKSGELVRTKLKEDQLKKIASATGGAYIPYTGENSVANDLVSYVNDLEKSEIETLLKRRYRERFLFFLVPALLMLLLSLFLGERTRPRKSIAAVTIVLLLLSGCEALFERPLGSVSDGQEALAKEEYQSALEHFQNAETEIPANPRLHYDLGLAHLGLGENELAIQMFTRALETNEIPLQFDAMFNMGLAFAAQEEWGDAYETFKETLKLGLASPSEIEANRMTLARENLELSFDKLYPPCATLEDALEDNDSAADASSLEGEEVPETFTLCGLDEDWYQIPAMPGTQVGLSATFTPLRKNPDPYNPFMVQASDASIEFFDGTGEKLLVAHQGEEDALSGEVAKQKAVRTIERFLVTPEMLAGTNALLVKVTTPEYREFSYDLDVTSIPPCHALQEASEPNHTPETAAPLTAELVQGHLCEGDEDLYRVTLAPGDSFFVDAVPGPDIEHEVPADVVLEIVAVDTMSVVATGIPEAGLLTAGVRDSAGGDYLVRISASPEHPQGPYTLQSYIYAPCPLGRDRFEPNDDPAAATPLDPAQPQQRYLRICPEDVDFFAVPVDEKTKRIELGLALISTPSSEDPLEVLAFSLDHLSQTGDQILDKSLAAPLAKNGEPTPLNRLLVVEDLEGESALVRVLAEGDGDFYHLVNLAPSNPSSEEDQKQEEQDGDSEKGEQEEENKDKKDDPESDDSESGDDSEPQDEKSDEGQPDKQEEETGEEEKPEDSADGSEQEEEGKEEEAQPKAEGEPAESGRVDDILQALEESDDNFQMRKALQKTRGRYIERDW